MLAAPPAPTPTCVSRCLHVLIVSIATLAGADGSLAMCSSVLSLLALSPRASYVVSGDADGKLNIWDWKTTKLYHRIKAHDKVCISALWHPHETSKVITCGWDGQIKLWD